MPKIVFVMAVIVLVGVLAYLLISRQIVMTDFILKSSAFKEGEMIPSKFTCDGENVSPLLEIRNVPAGTKSLALIVDDPDATGGKTWTHWLLFNIDPKSQYISEDSISLGAKEGTNSFGTVKYGGPCPPRGNPPHRYMFKLYALDTVLDLKEGVSRADLEQAMAGHSLGQTTLMGRYGRK